MTAGGRVRSAVDHALDNTVDVWEMSRVPGALHDITFSYGIFRLLTIRWDGKRISIQLRTGLRLLKQLDTTPGQDAKLQESSQCPMLPSNHTALSAITRAAPNESAATMLYPSGRHTLLSNG